MSKFARRPSPAMLVALIALVTALAGTALAGPEPVRREGDKIVKKRSLSGNRLRRDAVSGLEVKEALLGKVPKAKRADRLGDKGVADFAPAERAVAGISLLRAGPAPDGSSDVTLERGPFTVRTTCTDLGGGGSKLELTVESTVAGSYVDFTSPGGSSGAVGPSAPRVVYTVTTSAAEFTPPAPWIAVTPSGVQAQGLITLGLHKFGRDCLAYGTAVG
jgi:hypothetical protein